MLYHTHTKKCKDFKQVPTKILDVANLCVRSNTHSVYSAESVTQLVEHSALVADIHGYGFESCLEQQKLSLYATKPHLSFHVCNKVLIHL